MTLLSTFLNSVNNNCNLLGKFSIQSMKSSKNGFVEINVSIEIFILDEDELEEEDDAFDEDEATACDARLLFDLLDVRVDE